ncbi:hypothetical protein [Lacrimispora indolis]|uniref:hypothetical protein n=1 Tax=Lacrimispora indolis TaxID=69825 RepID=UPI00040118F9|nr:hypothetical protein [[Clostridium] methoxybenzovorans]
MDLEKFAKGNLTSQIREGIQKILENISDARTPAKARRQLIIKITFKPGRDRKNIKIYIETKINTAPIRNTESNMFIGQNINGEPVFYDTEDQVPGQISVGNVEGG